MEFEYAALPYRVPCVTLFSECIRRITRQFYLYVKFEQQPQLLFFTRDQSPGQSRKGVANSGFVRGEASALIPIPNRGSPRRG